MDEVVRALQSELSLPDVGTMTMVLVRVLAAAVLGGIIGWEREQKGRAAGLKTHMLVAMGSALFVLAPTLAGIDGGDNTRVMQGIVSGIGFLGAGAILRSRDGSRVSEKAGKPERYPLSGWNRLIQPMPEAAMRAGVSS